MLPKATTRRRFLQQSAGAMAAAGIFAVGAETLHAAAHSGPKKHAIRLGGPVFDAPQDPEGLALAHRKLGYRAAYCPGVGLNDTDRIRDIAAAFAKHDVVIAEVGRWCNLLDADPAKRAANLADGDRRAGPGRGRRRPLLRRHRRLVQPQQLVRPAPGEPLAAVLRRRGGERPEDHRRREAEAGEVLLRGDGLGLPDSPDAYLKMIKAVDRPAFGVHLDPCNLINSPEQFYRNTALLNECFDKLGPWIVSCHAKDLTWDVEMNVHFREVCIGAGALDYATYLKRLAALPGDVPLMIEHMKDAAEYDKSRRHLFEVGGKIGVSFG